jgi:propanol-preferring alcohol dehydrogenase
MIAMQIDAPHRPLRRVERPMPRPDSGQVLIEISACGVCRTDLHVLDGGIAAHYPVIPGPGGVS